VNWPEWLEDPRLRRLGLQIGAGIVVVALIVAGIWTWYRAQESRGEAALAAAGLLVQQASVPQPAPGAREAAIKALEGVLNDHPRFSGAPLAAYELGNLRFAAGQYASARSAYQLALAKGGSPTLKALAAVGIGYTWEAEKNYGNAAAAYEAALKTMATKDFLYEDALMSLARVQELAGNAAAAQATYQRLLKDVPDTRRGEDLRARLAELKSRSSK